MSDDEICIGRKNFMKQIMITKLQCKKRIGIRSGLQKGKYAYLIDWLCHTKERKKAVFGQPVILVAQSEKSTVIRFCSVRGLKKLKIGQRSEKLTQCFHMIHLRTLRYAMIHSQKSIKLCTPFLGTLFQFFFKFEKFSVWSVL